MKNNLAFNKPTSHCFGQLLDPQCRVHRVALPRVGVKDHEPVDAIDPATVKDLILEVSAKS